MIPAMNFATTTHLAVSYPEDWATLNPQPLPPKGESHADNPADSVSLNPQPLPPKEVFAHMEAALRASGLNPGAERGIIIVGGKQPEASSGAHVYGDQPGYWVSLNPQPLPPKEVLDHVETALKSSGFNPGADRGIIIIG